jgi:hypothetical protein
MDETAEKTDKSHLRRRALEIFFWIATIALLWTLDTLTKLQIRERTGVGLDDFRLYAEQVTSAAGVLGMVAFVAWWMNHFPLRRSGIPGTILGHVIGSVIFSLGHYTIMVGLRAIVYPLFGRNFGSPVSLWSNLVFEYQKDLKIYAGIVVIIAMYRLFLGGENRLQVRPRSAQKILVQTGSGEAVIAYDRIDYLESARNYVVVHADDREYLVRSSLSGLLERLAADNFVRSHRSFAVNLDKVTEIRHSDAGHVIHLNNGSTVPLSRSFRDQFKARMTG